MLDIRDIRALDGPNLYDLAPVTLVRYVGAAAAGAAFANRVAVAAAVEVARKLPGPIADDLMEHLYAV